MKRVGVRRRWEPVWTGPVEAEARIISGGLETDGVAARVNGSPGYRGPSVLQEGGWAIFVAESDVERAKALLEERGEGPNLVQGADGLVAENFRVLMPLTVLGLLALAVWALASEILKRA